MYFLQYVDQLSINSQPPIVRQKKCYFIARCCLVSFHLMKNRWDSNPWDTSALSLGPEKLCPHLPKKPSNNKLCTDISVGIAFGLVTPPRSKVCFEKKNVLTSINSKTLFSIYCQIFVMFPKLSMIIWASLFSIQTGMHTEQPKGLLSWWKKYSTSAFLWDWPFDGNPWTLLEKKILLWKIYV